MPRSTGSVVSASDGHSVRVVGCYKSTKSEGPAATLWAAVTVFHHRDAGPAGHPHRYDTNEGADMAQSTRGYPGSDSETRFSAVKITPVSSVSATVPTTSPLA